MQCQGPETLKLAARDCSPIKRRIVLQDVPGHLCAEDPRSVLGGNGALREDLDTVKLAVGYVRYRSSAASQRLGRGLYYMCPCHSWAVDMGSLACSIATFISQGDKDPVPIALHGILTNTISRPMQVQWAHMSIMHG